MSVTARVTTANTLPSRQLMRLQGEFHMCGAVALDRLLPGQYTRGILLLAVIRACIGDWTMGDRPAPPTTPQDGLSILSLAQSLHCPFETARRNVHRLIADGYCATDGRRVYLAHDGPHVVALTSFLADTHDNLMLLVESMAALGLLRSDRCATDDHPWRAIVRASLDQALFPLDKSAPFVSWMAMIVWGAIGAAAVRHITLDPVLSARYADIATPDELRRPVSVRRVSDALSVPPTTVWRHGRELAARGLVSVSGSGWTMADGNLTDERIAENVTASANYLMRKIREVVAHGLDPERIGANYLAGRPEYMHFGEDGRRRA